MKTKKLLKLVSKKDIFRQLRADQQERYKVADERDAQLARADNLVARLNHVKASTTFAAYQVAVTRTILHAVEGQAPNMSEQRLANFGLGLAGEAGKVADAINTHLLSGKPLDDDLLAREIGVVLGYVAMLADTMGMDLGVIAQGSVHELKARYPNGFNRFNRDDGPDASTTTSEPSGADKPAG